jgi:hypothetical protein
VLGRSNGKRRRIQSFDRETYLEEHEGDGKIVLRLQITAGILRRVASQKFTDVSVVVSASIDEYSSP